MATLILLALLAGCRSTALGVVTAPGSLLTAAARNGASWPTDAPPRAEVELGFRLFFEPRLSVTKQMSCATCHRLDKGFSNGLAVAVGANGGHGTRNVPTIYTMADTPQLFWDGRATGLEAQALGPIENPIEMGAKLPDVVADLAAAPYYPQKFQATFGRAPDAPGIARALSSFERALTLGPSAYDRFLLGDQTALSPAAKQGMDLFFSPRTSCASCHKGVDFTDHEFHDTGMGDADEGRFGVTGAAIDHHAFKTPTLRNVAATAPYMHDGSLPTLEAVMDLYIQGGRPGTHPDSRIQRLDLDPQEKAALVEFMQALSSQDNLHELGKLPGIR